MTWLPGRGVGSDNQIEARLSSFDRNAIWIRGFLFVGVNARITPNVGRVLNNSLSITMLMTKS